MGKDIKNILERTPPIKKSQQIQKELLGFAFYLMNISLIIQHHRHD